MKSTKARDIMTKRLIVLKRETGVYDAIETLTKNGISGAPVVDDYGNLVGIFSEKDCMRVLLTGQYHEMPDATVGAYLTDTPFSIEPETDLLAIGQIFLTKEFRRLPVLEEGRLVGQVSRRDVLVAMNANYAASQKTAPRPSQALYLSAVGEPPVS